MRMSTKVVGVAVAFFAVNVAIAITSNSSLRDPAQARAFRHTHPCPATDKIQRSCPGYVVDHIKPLCAGGKDHPSNMQWQTIAEAKKKDRLEMSLCRSLGTVR